MFERAETRACLAAPVGFRQTTNPAYPQIDTTLADGKTTYLNELHPLLTIENIKSIAPQFADYGGDESALISNYLKEIIEAAAVEVPQKVFQHKKLIGYGKALLQNVRLYDGNGSVREKIIKAGRFVGIAVRVKGFNGLKNIVNAIGLQADTAQVGVKLYVYHPSQHEPISTLTQNIERAGGFSWWKVDTALESNYGGGMYYIGYYEDELTGQVMMRPNNLAKAPCDCGGPNLSLYNQWSAYYDVHPFYVETKDLSAAEVNGAGETIRPIWDVASTNYTYTTNFGLNLELTAQCDLSPYLCRYAENFSYAVGLQAAEKLLTSIAYNTRNNAISRETRTYALHELNENKAGVPYKLKKAIEEIELDLSDLDSPCLPERNKSDVHYTGI